MVVNLMGDVNRPHWIEPKGKKWTESCQGSPLGDH